MTKEMLRREMKQLEVEIARTIRYEPSASVTLPVKTIERWRRTLFELSEDTVLWT